MQYDIAIIGGGIGGLMAAYRIREKKPAASILILEQGSSLQSRSCPILAGNVHSCVRCASCAIMEGMAGAGAFSDGKYSITTEYGGWLGRFLSDDTLIDYEEQADAILVKYGAPKERYLPNTDLQKLCLGYDLHMQGAQLKHLGTDQNKIIMQKFIDDLNVKMLTDTKVLDVKDHTVYAQRGEEKVTFAAHTIIFAVGRAGSSFLSQWCKKNDVPMENNQVDIGVRVELPAVIWEDFSKEVYEPKIWYRSKVYGDITRTFCFNDRGSVVTENTDGVITVNGHAYKEESRKTKNSNFALLSKTEFTQPFREPIEYAKYVASLANLISGNSILVQRFGDLIHGRRTNTARLSQGTVRPTLEAVPGDLSLCMPKRQIDNIIETIYALDQVAPGTANHDTLLYGVECKYYSARSATSDFELYGHPNIFAIGDGAGFTRSLSQAAANGLYVADKIVERETKMQLTDMPNMGKVNAEKLTKAGIDTPEKLKELGSKQALIEVREKADPGACLSMLKGLEGAIRGVRWHELPQDIQDELKEFYNSLPK